MFNHTATNCPSNRSSAQLTVWLMLACLLPTSAIAVPTQWQWAHPFPHGNQINATIWGDSEFIGVGDGGNIITSPDGAISDNWTLVESETSQNLNDIAWNGSDSLVMQSGEKRYVSVGDQGVIISTDSDMQWQLRNSGVTHKLTQVIWVDKPALEDSFFLVIGEYTTTINDPVNGSISRPAAAILTSPTGFSTWKLESATLNPDRFGNIPPPRLNGVTWNGSLFVASSDAGAILTSDDGIAWHTRSINGIAWNGSDYLAVGDNGLALTSSDGTSWTTLTSPVTTNLHAVTWGDDRFVITAASGTIINAKKTTLWTWNIEDADPDGLLTSTTLRGIASNGGLLVAVGDNGTILTRPHSSASLSPTWTARISGTTSNTPENLYDIALNSANFRFSVVGTNGTILTSTNGIDWAPPSAVSPAEFTTDLLNISSGNNLMIATGKAGTIISSNDDGATWTECATSSCDSIADEWLLDSSWDGTSHIVVGSNGTLITSTDGINWSAHSAQTTEHLFSIASDGASRVLIGGEYSTQIATNDVSAILSSDLVMTSMPDATTVTSGRITQEALNKILYFNNRYTTVGSAGTILTSDNAIYWTPPNSITGGSEIANDLFDISVTDSDDNHLTASGAWGTLLQSTDNGLNWNSIGPPLTGNADFLNGITSNLLSNPGTPTLVTAGSGGAAFTSTNNGTSWNATAGPTQTIEDINALAASDALLVAVGNQGIILNSSDSGISWATQVPTSTCGTNHLRAVSWSDVTSRFVAVGDYGTVCHSDDGTTWQPPPVSASLPDSSSTLYGITWGKEQFVAVGGSALNSVVYTSPDGDLWTIRDSNEPYILRDITWDQDHFIAVGDSGTIITSPKGISWTRKSSGTTTNLTNIVVNETTALATGATTAPLATTIIRRTGNVWQGGEDLELANFFINDLAFGGTQFAAVGPSGEIAVSENGEEWKLVTTGTNSLFKTVIWDSSKFITAGAAGHILYANNRDLVISGGFTTETVRDGETARYIFTVTNRGLSTATNVSYQGELSSNSTLLSASSSRGSCSFAQSLICLLDDMATGETATITIDITTTAVGAQLHRGTVTADGGNDSDEANNTIAITLGVSRGNAESGGAAIGYWSLATMLLFLFITRQKGYRRQQKRGKPTLVTTHYYSGHSSL